MMRKENVCYNIAHRGARSLAPENTMPAFIKAWQVGAHGVETDVSVSADGVLILFHDETFTRTTNIAKVYSDRKNKALHNFSWQEIQKLDAGSWFAATDPFGTIADGTLTEIEVASFHQTAVPTLEELLLFIKQQSWFINIEIKPLPKEIEHFPVVEKVLESVEKAQLPPDLFSISSFYHPFLQTVKTLWPEAEINALIGGKIGRPQQWGNFEFEIYNANVEKIDTLQLEKAKKHGCQVNLYTVNKLSQMELYLSQGIEKIITDYPQLLSR